MPRFDAAVRKSTGLQSGEFAVLLACVVWHGARKAAFRRESAAMFDNLLPAFADTERQNA